MTTTRTSPITQDLATIRASLTANTDTRPTPICPAPDHDPAPIARSLDEFVKRIGHDPAELLKHRYLCKGAGLLLVGATGLGKSSLAMQLMINWALGQSGFGLEPARPLKSLLVQAENDDGDLAEMKEGVFNGLNLTSEDRAEACKNIYVTQESSKTGQQLCSDVLQPLLTAVKPDLLWLDPALAYLGGDMNSQKDVGQFLRNYLAPLIAKHHCAVIIIHHTNKISKDPDKQMTDVSYLGAGSAEWINWCRAMLTVRKTDVENLYELSAAKRGARLKWKTADGEGLSFTKYIGHSKRPDTICWTEMNIGDAEDLKAGKGKCAADVLKHVPPTNLIAKDDLIQKCRRAGIGKNLVIEFIAQLIESDTLFEHRATREGKRAKILLSRTQSINKVDPSLSDYTRNSEGHYILPLLKDNQTKKL